MVDENQSSPRSKHACHLVQCRIEVGYRAQSESAHHGVEDGVVEWQRVRVTLPKDDLTSELAGAGPGNLEHFVAEIDPGELYARRVCVEVEACAHG